MDKSAAPTTKPYLSIKNIERFMPIDSTTLHHEIYFRCSGDVLEGISRHGDDVGLFARRENTKIIELQQFGCNACASLQRARRSETCRHHRLKFENAFAERKHAAVRSEGYFRFALCNSALRFFDCRNVASEFPDRMLGKPSRYEKRFVLSGHLQCGHEKRSGFLRHCDSVIVDEVTVLEAACAAT